MRWAIITVTGVAVAVWTVVTASTLTDLPDDVAAVEVGGDPASAPPAEPSPTPSPAPPAPTSSFPTTMLESPVPASSPAASSSAVASAPPAYAPEGAFVLGDSISLSVAPALSLLGYPVTGKVGQSASTSFLVEHLSSPAAQAAPAWVIVLGTNNAGDEEDLAQMREWIRTIRGLRTKGAKQEVFWVTPHRPPTYTGGMSDQNLDAFNTQLHDWDAAREWLTVLDYATTAARNDQWYEQDGQHLHPDAAGQEHLVDLIAGPSASPAPRPAPVTTIAPPHPSPSPSDTDAAFYEEFEFSNG